MLSDHETKSTFYKQVHCAKNMCVSQVCTCLCASMRACVCACVCVCVCVHVSASMRMCVHFFDLHKDNMPSGSENK